MEEWGSDLLQVNALFSEYFLTKIAWAFEKRRNHNVGQYFILRVEASQVSREGMKLVGTDDI